MSKSLLPFCVEGPHNLNKMKTLAGSVMQVKLQHQSCLCRIARSPWVCVFSPSALISKGWFN